MRNILVVVDSVDVNDSSGSKANVALIRNLSDAGFDVKVLHYTQKRNIQIQGIDAKQLQLINELKWNVWYVLSRAERWFTRYTKISLNRYLEHWFGFSFTFLNDSKSIASALQKENTSNVDYIITLSKGASFRPHHAILKVPEWHPKWIAYIHDPYPFHFYPRPYNWIQPGYAQKERFFKQVSEKAAYSAFPSQLLLEWMTSYFPNFENTGVVIPHQLEDFNVDYQLLPTDFPQDKMVLLHAGNLMKQRNPKYLIDAFVQFCAENPKAKNTSELWLVGAATYHEEYLLQVKKEYHNVKIITNNLPFVQVVAMQHAASVNIILEGIAEISPFLPGKFPHLIAANKPILLLGPYYSECKRLLGHDYLFWAEANHTIEIQNKINLIFDSISSINRDCYDYNEIIKYLGKEYLTNMLTKLK